MWMSKCSYGIVGNSAFDLNICRRKIIVCLTFYNGKPYIVAALSQPLMRGISQNFVDLKKNTFLQNDKMSAC